MSAAFQSIRRQPFITQAFANKQLQRRQRNIFNFAEEIGASEKDAADIAILRNGVAAETYEHFSLRYTGGHPLDHLRSELSDVIQAYERYQEALETHEQIPHVAPLGFEDIGDYERALQLVSLCYLLHRRDLLRRLRALLDPGYAGEDTVYEDLMAFDVAGRADVDEWYHAEPYSRLVNAMYMEQPEANIELKAYCDSWYKCFEVVPWHDSHTRIDGAEGDYFGYWAFEAAAVAFLYDLDDSAIDHMVYPRDLVTWARANKAMSEEDPQGRILLRCEGGQPCLQAGYWSTPAQTDSRRRFEAGELMPVIEGSAWGATIWYWDDTQG